MTTNILSNGSKWAGQSPDSIDVLLDVIAREPLEPRWGHPIQTHAELVNGGRHWGTLFGGNFYRVSHVFRIETDDPELIKTLTVALERNMATPEYIAAVAEYEQDQRDRKAYAIRKLEESAKQRRESARRTLGIMG